MNICSWHCPKCSKLLEACGELEVEGAACPVFQCDDCIELKEIFGEPFEVALTFMVKDGSAVDPVDETRM